jgi:hypothetical protein
MVALTSLNIHECFVMRSQFKEQHYNFNKRSCPQMFTIKTFNAIHIILANKSKKWMLVRRLFSSGGDEESTVRKPFPTVHVEVMNEQAVSIRHSTGETT